LVPRVAGNASNAVAWRNWRFFYFLRTFHNRDWGAFFGFSGTVKGRDGVRGGKRERRGDKRGREEEREWERKRETRESK
jgi:hypothetical protein